MVWEIWILNLEGRSRCISFVSIGYETMTVMRARACAKPWKCPFNLLESFHQNPKHRVGYRTHRAPLSLREHGIQLLRKSYFLTTRAVLVILLGWEMGGSQNNYFTLSQLEGKSHSINLGNGLRMSWKAILKNWKSMWTAGKQKLPKRFFRCNDIRECL